MQLFRIYDVENLYNKEVWRHAGFLLHMKAVSGKLLPNPQCHIENGKYCMVQQRTLGFLISTVTH